MPRITSLLLLACAAAFAQADGPELQSHRAAVLVAQGKYAEAEPLLAAALESQEEIAGPEDLSLTGSIGTLAALYRAQGRNADAQKLYEGSGSV